MYFRLMGLIILFLLFIKDVFLPKQFNITFSNLTISVTNFIVKRDTDLFP